MAAISDAVFQERIQEATPVDWQQGKALGACLVEMFDRSLWTDVKFLCKDHTEVGPIEAHKIVLAARSPVFQAMLFGPCADGKDEVDVKTAQSETFRLFLRYLYGDMITLTEEKALAVLEMAHLYQVSSLVQFCADYLATVIASGNVCRILTTAIQYELNNLKTVCCFFIDTHAEQVLISDGFMNLSAECLLYILKGDTLNADETVILKAAEKWSRGKILKSGLEETGTNIRKCLGESFYFLRFPTMTSKSLLKVASRKGYFSTEEYADIAAFIMKVPEIAVSTNSCVARAPVKESVLVNAEIGRLLTQDRISNVFEILVTKEIALSKIVLCTMKPYLECKKEMYADEDYPKNASKSVLKIDLVDYCDKVVKVTKTRYSYNITYLESLKGVDLPDNIELVVSGCILVKDMDFRRNFTLRLPSVNGNVTFNLPLLLKKKGSPYRVEINIKYRFENGIQIKTNRSTIMSCKSLDGHIQIRHVSGSNVGVKRKDV